MPMRAFAERPYTSGAISIAIVGVGGPRRTAVRPYDGNVGGLCKQTLVERGPSSTATARPRLTMAM